MAVSSVASTLKVYWIPLLLLATSVIFQLVITPRCFPPSHYDVLRIARYSSIEEVTEAYDKLSSKWSSGVDIPHTMDFIKIRYAFELLTNQLWKRDYDMFGIDEQVNMIEEARKKYAGRHFSEIGLPLLDTASFDPADHAFDVFKLDNFLSKLENDKPLLIQVFSVGSNRCAQFSYNWKKIDGLLDGVASTGMVELGDFRLSAFLAEKKPTGQQFFRNGLPSLVAFPAGCNTSHCLIRYKGKLSVDAVTDWFAATILNLPRIRYYSKELMVQSFLTSNLHKVKVIFISKTGERATPIVRQTAKKFWSYASFAYALWQEDDSSFWWNMFGVESAPAIVFLKDPGVKPVVYHGSGNNSWFLKIMEQNKRQVLPQLRSATSMELGCDPRGFSRAGNGTWVWYCVILVGRRSPELNEMRATMRRVQEILSDEREVNTVDQDLASAPASTALKEKRLTFAWLDGEVQKRYCFFYIHSEDVYDACGPQRDIKNVPQLFIIRYKRSPSEEKNKAEKTSKNILTAFHNIEVDPASQLVAKYNGSGEITQIIQWISHIIRDGDSRNLPFVKAKTPPLVPEDADPIWSTGTETLRSTSRGIMQWTSNIITTIYNHLGDPRIGPILLLGALMSFGSIWLRRSQSKSNHLNQQGTLDEARQNKRRQQRTGSNRDCAPSITDTEPTDAYQMPFSDSDSE